MAEHRHDYSDWHDCRCSCGHRSWPRLVRLWALVPLPVLGLMAIDAALTAGSGEVQFEHGGTGAGAFFCLGLMGSLYLFAIAVGATRR